MPSSDKTRIRSTTLRRAVTDFTRTEAEWLLKGGKDTETEAMLLGSLAHSFVLEGVDKTVERFQPRRGNVASKEHAAIVAAGRRPVPIKIWLKAEAMYMSMQKFLKEDSQGMVIGEVFANAKFEEDISFEDDDFVYTCKPDAYSPRFFVDYKTTSAKAVNTEFWAHHVARTKMEIQLALYYWVLRKNGYPIEGAYHLVQSTIEPYLVKAFFFPLRFLETMWPQASSAIEIVGSILRESSVLATIESLPQENVPIFVSSRSLDDGDGVAPFDPEAFDSYYVNG